MKVLFTADTMSATATSEPYCAFKTAQALSEVVDLTVLCLHHHRPELGNLSDQLPNAEVVTWKAPRYPKSFGNFGAMFKPYYPTYFRRVRSWLRTAQRAGRRFDIAHQLMPQAPRYPSPLTGQGLPYMIGPLGGALSVPPDFRKEVGEAEAWYTRIRKADAWRFRHDPWLRRSYGEADLILGVAPYVRDILSDIPMKRFETFIELGIDDLPSESRIRLGRGLKLLHVGRGVRTKGLRDVVRAMSRLKNHPDITLTSAGGGPEIAACEREAARLGVSDRITFEGLVPRSRVEHLYRTSDVFVFPSFREAAGNVVYEAMRNGLPVIAVDHGGPGSIIDETSGIKLPLSTPNALAEDIAAAVLRLHGDDDLRLRFGQGGQQEVARKGLWSAKAVALRKLYQSVLDARRDVST